MPSTHRLTTGTPHWVVIALLIAFAGCAAQVPLAVPQTTTQPLLGTPAPRFTLPSFDGPSRIDLAALAGQVVVVEFWASWCAPCATTASRLEEWQSQYGNRGLRVIGLSSEAIGDIARFASDHRVSYAMACDAADTIAAAYHVTSLPTLVIVDRAGVVRYVDVGARDLDAVAAALAKLLN